MNCSDYYWHERNGPAPRVVPVVAAVQVRMGEQRGVELHLAEDPEYTVARVWTDGRITLVRGSFAVSRRWPQPVSNVRNVALLLIRNITNGWIMGESGPLEQFNAEAAEVDALGLHVLAAAAAELRRTARQPRRR